MEKIERIHVVEYHDCGHYDGYQVYRERKGEPRVLLYETHDDRLAEAEAARLDRKAAIGDLTIRIVAALRVLAASDDRATLRRIERTLKILERRPSGLRAWLRLRLGRRRRPPIGDVPGPRYPQPRSTLAPEVDPTPSSETFA